MKIHVRFRLTDGLSGDALARAAARLSPDERARADRFRFHRDRRDFVAAHALLRETLSLNGGEAPERWDLVATDSGKPVLAGSQASSGLTFNLSHTHGLVACVVGSEIDVGIDVEHLTPRVDPLDLARRYFSPAEVAYLMSGPDADRSERFVEVWTLKESYIKAVGMGLSHPLDTFSLIPGIRPAIHFVPPEGVDPRVWHFAMATPSEWHRMAVAVRTVSGHAPEMCIEAVEGEEGE